MNNYGMREIYFGVTKWKKQIERITCRRKENEVRIVLKYCLYNDELYTHSCISLQPYEWQQRLEKNEKSVNIWVNFGQDIFRQKKNMFISRIISLYNKVYKLFI